MPNTTPSKPTHAWYVLCVKPNTERKVSENLQKQGFETCLPTQRVRSERKDRQLWLDKVIFTGYVFVFAPCLPKERKKVFIDKNILCFLCVEGKPSPLRESEAILIRHLATGTTEASIVSNISVGEAVQIISGSLAGLDGVVMAWQDGQQPKVYLAIPSLRCTVCLTLEENILQKQASI